MVNVFRLLVTSRRRYNFSPRLIAGLFLTASVVSPLRAQQPADAPLPASHSESAQSSVQEQLRAMREEISALRQEVAGLRQELNARLPLRAASDNSAPVRGPGVENEMEAGPPAQAYAEHPNPLHESKDRPTQVASTGGQPSGDQPSVAELASTVSMLQSQIAEQAQTKVESSSKMPVKLFGTILSNTFFNTRAVDWQDVPTVVQPYATSAVSPSPVSGSFGSSVRQSRFGLAVDGPQIGSMRASGYLAADFYGGDANFQSAPIFGIPHIVYAYMRLENEHTAIEAGQDEAILAPRHPTSLVAMSYPDLYHSGSLYDRAPQVRVEQDVAHSSLGTVRATIGLVDPVANYPGLDYPYADLEEGWQRPAVEGRLAWRSPETNTSRTYELGLSGHYGRLQLPIVPSYNSSIVLGQASAASWAGVADFDARAGKFGADGEFYLGQNLQSFGGGIGQPGKTLGGYIEGRILPGQKLQFNGGYGSDHMNESDVYVPVVLNRNTSVYANTIFQFTPEVAASFEYRHLVTRSFNGHYWANQHFDIGIAYSF